MTLAADMLEATPASTGVDREGLADAIAACFECSQVCTACADACLAEDMVVELRRCITLDLNCADICASAGRTLSRQTEYDAEVTRSILTACRDTCRRCAAECEQHASMHEHCRICADACRRCEQACEALLAAIG